MDYVEMLPHPALSAIIECYWSVRGRVASSHRTIYPDGCMDVVYDFSERRYARDEERTFIVGNMTRPIQTFTAGSTDILGIRFRPAGLSRLLKSPLSEFNDQRVILKDIMELPDEVLLESLQGKDPQQRIALLNKFFSQKINCPARSNSYWQYCVDQLLQNQGNVSIRSLSGQSGVSQKQLERKFKQNVGLTPKQLGLILRFRELKSRLENSQGDLLQLAVDLHYSDQAHLTKSFKAFAGITPTEYLRTRNF